jgi:aminoglycoside phosphotransferase (APT) family kinase protein
MSGDNLNIEDRETLTHYLEQSGRVHPGELTAFDVLPGGVSSRTVRVELRSGAAWVLKQALPRLRVAVEWFSDPVRVHREALGLHRLAELAPAGSVPALVFEDEKHHVLAMTAVPRPHDNWKALLLAGRVHDDHVAQFGRLLGTIHRQAWHRRLELQAEFDDRSFFESLRVEPYYQYSAGQEPAAAEFYAELVAGTRARRMALVHGDYSPKNVLVQAARLILLDHEVIHFGDPAFDVGFGLTHLLAKAHHVRGGRTMFSVAAGRFWETYAAEVQTVPWADEVEANAVCHTLGCLLARVVGRSPLEYLDAAAQQRQRAAALDLMARPPRRVGELVREFLERV